MATDPVSGIGKEQRADYLGTGKCFARQSPPLRVGCTFPDNPEGYTTGNEPEPKLYTSTEGRQEDRALVSPTSLGSVAYPHIPQKFDQSLSTRGLRSPVALLDLILSGLPSDISTSHQVGQGVVPFRGIALGHHIWRHKRVRNPFDFRTVARHRLSNQRQLYRCPPL